MLYSKILVCLLLLFTGSNTISIATAGDSPAAAPGNAAPISSKVSLVHLGSIDSFTITEQGTLAGRLLLNALENKDSKEAAAAKVVYHAIIPKEHYGGEYTALEWFCDYLLGTDDDRRVQLADRFHRSFFGFFAENDFANLKEYLGRKYKLKKFADSATDEGRDRLSFLEDFILFNNPRREEWERTSKIVECLKIQPGATIADVGSGPGYYTFKFAELTGASGKVYAIDTVQNHLDYVQNVSRKYGLSNIETVKDRADGINLNPDTADLVFMCSLYHIIYTTSTEEVKDRFVESVKEALKPEGRLVVVDNAVVQDGQLPYHGPHIAKELVIGQLYYYGFDLTEQYQFIPQRYVLVFKKRT
ncbi:MAG: class I SAM-dependent methyltransferase [Verrucomicrobia bacterium]|nr:class I SAM-dependent methyltransferase [Verrucomicrobiota bacterium]